MYRQTWIWAAGLYFSAGIATPAATLAAAWTADQFVQAALVKNRDFLATRERIREARGLLTQAGAGIADTLEIGGLSGQAVRNSGEDSVSATYSHTFETFGKRERRIEIAQKELTRAQMELAERRRTLANEVQSRYVDAAAAAMKLAVIDRLSKINADYLRLTEARVQKGDVAQLEANLLRVEVKRDQSRQVWAESTAASALLLLKSSAGLEGGDRVTATPLLSIPSVSADLAALIQLALQNRPDLRLLEIDTEQRQSQVALARVETKPNLTLSGQYAHTDSSFAQYGLTRAGALTPVRDHDNFLGMGLSIPLTSARRNRGNIEAHAARQAAAQLQSDYLRGAIPAQVEAAFLQWRAAETALSIFDQGVIAQSEQNLDVMRKAYQFGEFRLTEVLNEQRRLMESELSYIDTQADRFRAYLSLEQAVGGSLQ